jgi:hypothetical protein
MVAKLFNAIFVNLVFRVAGGGRKGDMVAFYFIDLAVGAGGQFVFS